MAPDRKSKTDAALLAGLKVEMATARSTASARGRVPRRLVGTRPLSPPEVRPSPGNIFSAFMGVYKRIALKLNVNPSLVSKVASGSRKSFQVQGALLAELKTLKEKLTQFD